jgi:processing peptidase subunit alpha
MQRVRRLARAATSPVARLANGVRAEWVTSPGPIAGVGLNVNLLGVDALLPKGLPETVSNSVVLTAEGCEANLASDGDAHLSLIPFIAEKFAFKKTERLSERELSSRLEGLIGCATAKSHKHSVFIAGTVPETQVSETIKLLWELAQGPAEFTDEDIEELYRMLQYEAWELKQPLRFEDMLTELAHRAAYNPYRTVLSRASPVLFGAKDEVCAQLQKAATVLRSFWQGNVLAEPGRYMTVVGGGAEEASGSVFWDACANSFGKMGRESEQDRKLAATEDASASVYCGGALLWADEEAPLVNLSVSLQCPPVSSADSVTLAILQMLLGGGGSFSAGGPGKGMYSRLYTQLLNRYSWLESARAFSVAYGTRAAGGIFGINASCVPERAPQLIRLILSHLSTHLASSLTSGELNRAKNQVKSALLMGLESRSVLLESVAEQLSVQDGVYMSPSELCERIDNVGETELVELARSMATGSNLTFVAHGPLQSVPSYAEIQQIFRDQFLVKLK